MTFGQVQIDYDVSAVTALPGLVSTAVAGTTATPGQVSFSRGALMEFGVSIMAPAEGCAQSAAFYTIDTAQLATLMAQPGSDLSTVLPAFGGAVDVAMANWPASGSASSPANTKETASVYYLAAVNTIRRMWEFTRPNASTTADVLLPAESGQGNIGIIPFLAAAPYIIVGVGIFAAAAYAWVKHDDAVETARAQVAIKTAEADAAARVQIALGLGQTAIAAGQTISIPDIIANAATREHAARTAFPWFLGGAALILGGALAVQKKWI